MIQQTISRKLAAAGGIAAVMLAASLPSLRAGAQPAGDSAPHAQAGTRQPAPAGESMRQMPGAREKRVVAVTGKEDWEALRGFGKDSGMVAMMTLMMVGGSGMEHMKMAPMKSGGVKMAGMNMGDMPMEASGGMSPSSGLPLAVTVTPNPPIVGDNTLDIAVTDAGGKPVTGLKLAATVAMTSMDMGTTKPKVTEGQDGHYAAVVSFAMKGPWRVTLTGGAPGETTASAVRAALDFNVGSTQKWGQPAGPNVTLNTPPGAVKVGKNPLEFTILDAAGKPMTGAKVTTAVAMTSMDMGTTHPPAKEDKAGHYTTEAEFSMKGPWRVTVRVAPPNQQPFTRAFDLNVVR